MNATGVRSGDIRGGHRPARRALAFGLALLAGCTPTRFETRSDVPAPLIDKMPVAVGVHLPLEFREKVYEEKRPAGGGRYAIGLGKAQSAGLMRVLEAMFDRVEVVTSLTGAGREAPGIRGVLQPVLDDYAFVTPADSGTQVYAASLRYTIRLYTPQGQLLEAWTFTGYGSQAGSAFPGKGDEALEAATRLALRDAAAKLAAEFPEQAIGRSLLVPGTAAAPSEVAPPPQDDPARP